MRTPWTRTCGGSNECGVLEDPWVAPPEDAFQFVVSHAHAPDEPQRVVVSFERGTPVALHGKPAADMRAPAGAKAMT